MTEETDREPLVQVTTPYGEITLLGTAHVSRQSAEKVRQLLTDNDYDAVAVELCPSRYQSLIDPDAMSRMNLMQVLREGKASMVTASLAMGAYQQRLADQFGIRPGEEQRTAISIARDTHLPVLLIDRDIGTTLKRTSGNLAWWKRWTLLSGLMMSLVSREEVDEEEIERLKEGDMLETTFAEFAHDRQDLFEPLIAERDRYMAARLLEEQQAAEHGRILAVIGAGHLKGIAEHLTEGIDQPKEVTTALEQIPQASRWPKFIPWIIVALILVGFAIGFQRSPDLGWQLVADWVLINGGLSAIGAALAAAHPLTVATAFLAAPLTSLNPTVGAGMVTAAAEIFLRKPQVGDFSALRQDTTRLSGWWRNRVSRTLLVFLFSTLGSAAGTYIAGFKIIGRLAG